MKPRKNSLKYLICGAAAALSLIAVPAAAEQDSPRLTVAFISDAAQGKTTTHKRVCAVSTQRTIFACLT
jgi:hypothetical protein